MRVWVAGCATGEEAYSIAMLLHEATANHPERAFKIFATDVHRGSLELAARAFYGEDALRNVSPERRDRYFIRSGAGYQLVPELRQSIVFAPHNVIKDAPFTRIDLISCRNMLIYLQPTVQQKVLAQFHFALRRGGVMFLGPSESPGVLVKDFATVDRPWRIYKKHSDVRIPVDPRLQPRRGAPAPAMLVPSARSSMAQLLATYDVLLDEVMPPSLLVNDRWELVHAFAGASKFLRPRDGRQALELSAQVGDELGRVLSGGLRRALLSEQPIVFKHVLAEPGDGPALFDVTLRRVTPRGASAAHVLISFAPVDGTTPRAVHAATEVALDDVSRDQVGALQSELDYTKENLQSAIEQLETGNEELQASNEELMSSNEELQSTNEELQSVNEELYTVNAEYQSKIAELTELTNDMDNLLASTDIGTIFLDGELRIRKFTPQIAESFNLLPHDVGRSIETFTSTLDHPGLTADVRAVLATGTRVEREVRDRRGHDLFLRILPYRAKGGTSGAVITLVDVSSMKATEDALFHARYLLDSLLSSVPDAIYFRDTTGRFIRVNPAAAARLQLDDPARAVGKTPTELTQSAYAVAVHREDDEVLRTGTAQHYKLESWRDPEGPVEWSLATRLPLLDREQHIVGVIGVARDVTAQKQAEELSQQAVRRRDEFLAMLSHELRNPLAAVVSATEVLKASGEVPPERQRLLDILDRQSQQMARLLDDLLEASRVTQNKIELRKRRVDLREVVDEAIAAARPAIAARKQQLAVELAPESLPIDGDPSRLQQVFVNLLTNAVKYTPEGGHLGVQIARDGGDAIIRVRDDGMGIAPGMIDAVFDLFVQSYRTLDRAQGGIGVGLTLARALVEMHGGTIEAASEGEGRGSTFVVRIPLADGPANGVREPAAARRDQRGQRVLVVEDNEDAREMLCQMLSRAGFECRAVGDGLAALALVDGFRPHAAIIDVGLPGIDGFEIARRLRRDPTTAVATLVAVTGYGQPRDRSAALEAGFDAHVVKPVKLDELVRVLDASRARDTAPA
jgi:two-component system CheB/CheR fusion protein